MVICTHLSMYKMPNQFDLGKLEPGKHNKTSVTRKKNIASVNENLLVKSMCKGNCFAEEERDRVSNDF